MGSGGLRSTPPMLPKKALDDPWFKLIRALVGGRSEEECIMTAEVRQLQYRPPARPTWMLLDGVSRPTRWGQCGPVCRGYMGIPTGLSMNKSTEHASKSRSNQKPAEQAPFPSALFPKTGTLRVTPNCRALVVRTPTKRNPNLQKQAYASYKDHL